MRVQRFVVPYRLLGLTWTIDLQQPYTAWIVNFLDGMMIENVLAMSLGVVHCFGILR